MATYSIYRWNTGRNMTKHYNEECVVSELSFKEAGELIKRMIALYEANKERYARVGFSNYPNDIPCHRQYWEEDKEKGTCFKLIEESKVQNFA